MLIQCTKKLLDELALKPGAAKKEQPLFSWHANLITVNHRKTVVLCNDSSRYILVLHGLKAKDFKNIAEIIVKSIRETFLVECIKAEIIEQFIDHSPEITYAKTSDRSMTAKLNKACDNVRVFTRCFNPEGTIQTEVGIRASNLSVGEYDLDSRHKPSEAMYKDLEEFTKMSIFRCKAVVLKVILDLENHDVERKIIVPLNITFKNLHDILQIAFDWKDYHLHDFYIFDGDKPILNLVCSDDAFEYPNDVPMIMESGVRLLAYVPKYNSIKYGYDFGDNWEHYMEVEKIIDDYPKNYPVCLSGVGNAPPEDVGGEGGYDEFLEAISNTDHPEHNSMVSWGKMQGYKDFDIELVNRRLRLVLNGFI